LESTASYPPILNSATPVALPSTIQIKKEDKKISLPVSHQVVCVNGNGVDQNYEASYHF